LQGLRGTSQHNIDWAQAIEWKFYFLHRLPLNIIKQLLLLGFIFHEHLTFSEQISALSKSCYSHIRDLRCIRPYLDFKTANTIATSIVHSKLD